jgi:hypothetical protein
MDRRALAEQSREPYRCDLHGFDGSLRFDLPRRQLSLRAIGVGWQALAGLGVVAGDFGESTGVVERLAGDRLDLQRFQEVVIRQCGVKQDVVRRGATCLAACGQELLSDSRLEDHILRMEVHHDAGDGGRPGADGLSAQAGVDRAATGLDDIAGDVLDRAFVLVVVHAGAQ